MELFHPTFAIFLITISLFNLCIYCSAFSLSNNDLFTCGSLRLPISYLNDDFCDCPDGTDEIKTAACAGKNSNSLFFCETYLIENHYIPLSRVGDGICDCCNGIDEKFGNSNVKCADVCEEKANNIRYFQENRNNILREGIAKQAEYIEKAKRIIEEENIHKAQLNQQLQDLKQKYQNIQFQKDIEEEKERDERNALKQSLGDFLELAPLAKIPENNLRRFFIETFLEGGDSAIEFAISSLREKATESIGSHIDNTEIFTIATEAIDARHAMIDVAENRESVIVGVDGSLEDNMFAQEYEVSISAMKSALMINSFDKNTIIDIFIELIQKENLYSFVYQYCFKILNDPLPETLPDFSNALKADEHVRSEAEEVRKALIIIEEEIKKLEEELLKNKEIGTPIFGDENEFLPLYEKCFDKEVDSFEYNICLYGKARQDHTSIGHFSSFENGIMEFNGGVRCWQGVERQLTVTFVCGIDDAIIYVEEPEICKYEALFQTPAVCYPKLLGL